MSGDQVSISRTTTRTTATTVSPTPTKAARMMRRRRSGSTRRAQLSLLDRELRDRFVAVVLDKRPVVGYTGLEVIQAHHVIPKRVIRSHHRTFGLEPEEILYMLWDPENGLPIAADLHEAISPPNSGKLSPADLRRENVVYARRHGFEAILEREVPGSRELFG